jgi:hypothetical protein
VTFCSQLVLVIVLTRMRLADVDGEELEALVAETRV